MFEKEFAKYLEEQKRTASPRRLERLNDDLTGTYVMFKSVLWPIFKSFDGFTLEYELKGSSGARIYVDAFHESYGFCFESEGFVPHAQNITRDRFSFERRRVRTIAAYKYIYVPFAWDELDKNPELCQRTVYEIMGLHGDHRLIATTTLSVAEREIMRNARFLNRDFRLADVNAWLQVSANTSRKAIKGLIEKRIIQPVSESQRRIHKYRLEE